VELIILILFLALIYIWIKQFVFLMMLDDSSLPGKYDKPVWGTAFIFLFPIAPFAFMLFKFSYLSLVDQQKNG
jgi:hypothetical protein